MPPTTYVSFENIRLGDPEFWSLPRDQREAAFARLRRIVSRGFTRGTLRKLEADVERAAAGVIDGVEERGNCDFTPRRAVA